MHHAIQRAVLVGAVMAGGLVLTPAHAFAGPPGPPSPANESGSCIGIATSENATTMGGTTVAAIIAGIRDFYGQAGQPLAFYARLHEGTQQACNAAAGG